MHKTIFLDRDGVINVDSPLYIKNPDEFEFIPKSAEAIALLNKNNFNIIIITNQSIIGRDMANKETLDAIFNKMKTGVKNAGGTIKDIFYCPHTPEDNCKCRKPKPELILKAKRKYNIDLKQAYMIGDSAKDIECAINAGCGKTILVRTGNGLKAQQTLTKKKIIPDYIAPDLYSAAEWLLKQPFKKC